MFSIQIARHAFKKEVFTFVNVNAGIQFNNKQNKQKLKHYGLY